MTNEQLMILYGQGNVEAFDELFERIHHRVYSYISKNLFDKNECDDVVQNVFIKLHMTKEKYRDEHPFDAWLFVIARSVLYDHLRKIKSFSINELKQFDFEDSHPEIDETLSLLDSKSQNIVKMKYLDELSYEEIAKVLNTSSANIRQIISRSFKYLRKNKEAKNGK